MINEFIDKILVHAPYYIDGERMQEVEIYLNFIGKFEIPQPQLSEEEIKRQKQLKNGEAPVCMRITVDKRKAEIVNYIRSYCRIEDSGINIRKSYTSRLIQSW